MDFLPLHFNLQGAPVLLVGGGEIARRKAVLISEAGAVLVCVSPKLEFDLTALSADHAWREKTFDASDVVGMRLVVAATDDALVNERVSLAAQAKTCRSMLWISRA